MKITSQWLKDYLDTSATPEEMAEVLTRQGLCVEDMENPATLLAPFKTVKVTKAEPHPDADRLKVCTVDTGEGITQVVCGGTNARTGIVAVLAKPGMTIPANQLTMKVAKIRGVESHGMLCSSGELGLGETDDGSIIELPANTPLGISVAEVFGIDDTTLDIEITPNRGDCLGAYGFARELAAGGLGALKTYTAKAVPAKIDESFPLSFDFPEDKKHACPLFTGRIIRGVKNGPSPQWLQNRLKAVGVRPISVLVDITNYLAYDLGRPMHAFDLSKLQGGLTLSLSKGGENFEALDGEIYKLPADAVIIRDEKKLQSLAGIMGGLHSAVEENTTDIFLESALFDPILIANAGRASGINSDSRYRFERGVDPELVIPALEKATAMILELCGGTAGPVTTLGRTPKPAERFAFNPELLKTLGGVETLSQRDVEVILDKLGFDPKAIEDQITIAPPSWRHDIDGPADIVEEILRVKGYDLIPEAELPPILENDHQNAPNILAPRRRQLSVRRALLGRGYAEAMGFSFMSDHDQVFFGEGVPVKNPISEDLNQLRTSLLPHLLKSAARAQAKGTAYGKLYEVGNVFHGSKPGEQSLCIAGILWGETPRHWQNSSPLPYADFFQSKADVLSLLSACGMKPEKVSLSREVPAWLHPGQGARYSLGPKNILGYSGVVHPQTADHYDIKGPVSIFELYLDQVPYPKNTTNAAFDLSPYPSIERDFAFVVDEAVESGKVLQAALKVDPKLSITGDIFDIYTGDKLESGKKSVAICLTFSNPEKTFEEAEIQTLLKKVQDAVEKTTGGVLRA